MMKSWVFLFLMAAMGLATPAMAQGATADSVDVLHYSIHLDSINTDDHRLAGWTAVTFVPRMEPLTSFSLELQSLQVDSVLMDGNAVGYSQQDLLLSLQLPAPLSLGDTSTVSIWYRGTPFHEAWGGYHYSGDYTFNLGVGFESIPHNLGKTWFPCVDDFTDRASYSVFATVADTLIATGGGVLEEVIQNGDGTQTWHWEQDHAIPTYLVSVATGDYRLYSDSYDGIEETIPVEIYTRPSDTAKVAGSFVNLPLIMDFFESHFGAYPFHKVGYTSTAIGAMEHAGNISYPHFAINGGTSYESLYTHELSHMWFGDAVTCSTAEDMWLNEGWATFCEYYYPEVLYGHQAYLNAMRTMHQQMLLKAHVEDGGYWAVSNIPQEVTYGKTAYDKGGTVADALRGYLGDSIFFDAMTAYISHFKYQSVSSQQMEEFLSSHTGIDLGGFFDAWVFMPGTPHFSIDSVRYTPLGNGVQADVYLRQKYKGVDFLAQDVIVQIGYLDQQMNITTDTVHFSGRNGHSIKILGKQPLLLMMDPMETAWDATTDNYRIFTEPVEYAFPDTYFKLYVDQCSDSSFVRVTHHWAAPDSLRTAVSGLTISPYRYWEVEGITADDFSARGRFYFSQGGYLDGDLIHSANDSVVILYRESAAQDWRMVDQELIGTWMIGYIFVTDLMPGQYTVAVWDKTLVGEESKHDTGSDFEIYPNPSRGTLNFRFAEPDDYHVMITRENGMAVDTFDVPRQQHFVWEAPSSVSGLLLVSIYRKDRLMATWKALIQ